MRLNRVAGAVILALALSACGASAKTDPKPTASPHFSASIDPATTFIASIPSSFYTDDWDTGAPSDSELLDFPPHWCAALRDGHSVAWMLDQMDGPDSLYPVGEHWGTNIIDARQLVVLGVTAFCPKYRSQVVAELRDNGQY